MTPLQALVLLLGLAVCALTASAQPLIAQVYTTSSLCYRSQCCPSGCTFLGSGCSSSRLCDILANPSKSPDLIIEEGSTGMWNFTGGQLYYDSRPVSSGYCFSRSYKVNSNSGCITNSDYEQTYLAYYYPNGTLERDVDVTFLLGQAIFNQQAPFNATAFIDAVGSKLNITTDRMTLIKMGNATVEYGQLRKMVVVRVNGSTAQERDYLTRWFKASYVMSLANDFFVTQAYWSYTSSRPGSGTDLSSAPSVQRSWLRLALDVASALVSRTTVPRIKTFAWL